MVVLELLERTHLGEDVRLRVADELRREARRPREVGRALELVRPAGARDLAVPLHLAAVAVHVDRLPALLGQLDRELDRESVRRRECERLLSRDRLVGGELLEEPETALEGLGEALLLDPDDPLDRVGLRGQLRIGVGHLRDRRCPTDDGRPSRPMLRACCTARRMIRRST